MSTRSSTRHAQSVGKKFGRLTVRGIEFRGNMPFALCVCECGKGSRVQVYRLYDGHTKSCGCMIREITARRSTKHGFARTPTYRVWQAMKSRCLNVNGQDYERYGGRGITVCDRWLTFDNFLADMGERPAGMEIDRIDNDGDYEPSNCRWATRKEQNRNSTHNRNVTHGGKTQCVTAWAEELGTTRKVIYGRLRRGEPVTGVVS
jgi:hypothetical protein